MASPTIGSYDVVVIGGGAAGFFAAIHAKTAHNKVAIIEKSNKLLSKVKISGGGRCNVTHACFDNTEFARFYPRGEKQLRKAFYQFNSQSTIDWYEKRGVKLYAQEDNRMFPTTNDSQTIIDCLLQEVYSKKIEILTQHDVNSLKNKVEHFEITTLKGIISSQKVILATGGQPKDIGLEWLRELGLSTVSPVPSLFSFNIQNNALKNLMGNSVEQATVKIEGMKLVGKGPLLITHWGLSGPAVLQLSAWGARILADKNYQFNLFVNWLSEMKEEELRQEIAKNQKLQGEKMVHNSNPFPITNKIWNFLLEKQEMPQQVRWKDITGKLANKMVTALLFDQYAVKGKTTFKEEFVTAGGVSLNEINFSTMESKKIPNLYFAGELLDIDGITGGFNFQAAWTTGYIAGINAAKSV